MEKRNPAGGRSARRTAIIAQTLFLAQMLFLPVLLLLLAGPALARQDAPPLSFSGGAGPLSTVEMAVMPLVDEARYLAEDEANAATKDTPLRFAAPLSCSFTARTDGTWETLADGSRIWRLRVVSTGARSLNFGLTQVRLPEGATLHLYAAGSREYDGPYTAADIQADGSFWTGVVPGDDALIELFVPAHPAFSPELTVSQVGHDYRGFGRMLQEKTGQGSCNNDVICPVGDPWRAEIRSEAVYTLNGSWTCSGQLVNSFDATRPPYFLTANHCSISTSNASSIVVYWRYEAPTCGALSGGSLTYHQTGSTLCAKYSSSDFCLVRLSATPSSTFLVYYAGWDATTSNAPSSAVGIHHPQCQEKAISFCNSALTITSYLGTSVPGDNSHWRINHWDDGTTEPGSSGSGLWDPSHHLVGQLHGGYASCTSLTSDYYGRLAISWNGGGSPANRLKDWLDPNSTGVQVCGGYDSVQPAGACCDPTTGLCSVTIADNCVTPSVWHSEWTSCDPDNCPTSGIGEAALQKSEGILSAAPNPFSGSATLSFRLAHASAVRLEIFDPAGHRIWSGVQGSVAAGLGSITWDGRGASGSPAAPGVYFARLTAGERSWTRPLIRVM